MYINVKFKLLVLTWKLLHCPMRWVFWWLLVVGRGLRTEDRRAMPLLLQYKTDSFPWCFTFTREYNMTRGRTWTSTTFSLNQSRLAVKRRPRVCWEAGLGIRNREGMVIAPSSYARFALNFIFKLLNTKQFKIIATVLKAFSGESWCISICIKRKVSHGWGQLQVFLFSLQVGLLPATGRRSYSWRRDFCVWSRGKRGEVSHSSCRWTFALTVNPL